MNPQWVLKIGLSVVTCTCVYAAADVLDPLKMVVGDEKQNDIKALKTELLVTSAENKALDQLQMLLRKHKGTSLEPELLLRLAELYMRRSKTERFFEISRTSQTLVRFIPPAARTTTSKSAIHKAIEVYEKIGREFPSYSKIDFVYFNNAFARQQIGQQVEAERLYIKVIQKFPHSPLIAEAHLATGEIEFDRHKFEEALEHFKAIQQFPNSKVYPYGIYKGAWSLYNLKRNVDALKELEKVVSYGKMVEEKHLDARLDLRKEALADMTIFFEDVMGAAHAYTYFTAQAKKPEVPGLLLRLSELYQRHSRHEDRKTLLLDFIRKLSDAEELPDAYDALVHNYEDMRNRPEAVAALKSFDSVCEQRLPKPELAKKCAQLISETTLSLGAKWLRTWKKNSAYTEFADAAEKAFEIYLRRSAPSHEKSESRYAYAELLFQRKKFREAIGHYEIVAREMLKESMGHDAAYAGLLSLEKAMNYKWAQQDKAKFREKADFYIKNFPKGKYRLDIEFKVALIAYEKGRYDEAALTFFRLGKEYASQEKGLKAQDLYLDILNIKKDYSGLKNYSAGLLKQTKDSARTTKLQKIYRESYFIEIQKMEEKGDVAHSAIEYKKFAKDNMSSDLAPKAWWNAMGLEFKNANYSAAAASAEAYYDQFPKTAQALDALLKAAETYESMGQLPSAARVLMKLAVVDSKNTLKWKTLAADFQALSHQNQSAQKLYQELRAQKEDSKIASYALDKWMLMQKKTLSVVEYHRLLESIAKGHMQPQASLAKVELVEETFKSGATAKAFGEAKEVLNMGETAALSAKARARLVQAQILEEEFIKASVKAKLDRLALVLAIKTEKLEKAQAGYQAVIRYGDPKTTITALARLASCYTHYVQALKTMPAPEGISTAEAEAFRSEVQRLSIPLEEKGVDTIAQAVTAAKKMKLYDGTVARLQSELDQMNMKNQEGLKVEFPAPALALPKIAGNGL